MSQFRTPLFFVVAALSVTLGVLGVGGVFEQTAPNPIHVGSQYIWARGQFKEIVGKSWIVELDALGATPAKTRAMIIFTNPLIILDPSFVAGARWQGWVRALPGKRLYQEVAPDGNWLRRYGASLAIAVDSAEDIKVVESSAGISAWLFKGRTFLARRIRVAFDDRRVAGLIGGLVLGEKRLLDTSLKEKFADVGVAHLLVVSGLHVSLWGSMIWVLAVYVFSLNAKAASLASGLATWLFAAGVGLTPPVIRSAVMMTALTAAPLLRRELPAISRLFAAALIMLLCRPIWIQDASFQLSLASTFGVLYGWEILGPLWEDWKPWARFWAGLLATSVFAWYAVWPVTAAWFHQISIIGPLANVFLVPASGLLLGLGAAQFLVLDWIPGLCGLGRWLLELLAHLFLKIVDMLSGWPAAVTGQAPWLWWDYAAWTLGFLVIAPGLGVNRKIGVSFLLVFVAAGAFARWQTPAAVYLLSGYSGIEAFYEERSWNRRLCLDSQSLPDAIPGRLQDFLQNRGAPRVINSCDRLLLDPGNSNEWYAGAAWSQLARQPVVRCGLTALIFPLTPFPIIAEEPPSKMLRCKQGQLVDITL
ncbi:MAG: ComEC/Rec2 family competence protein [Elusimicrobia bacterium]|nr:ComEC/Rec2 family competence protein [Elusimicrobiota bacterium]